MSRIKDDLNKIIEILERFSDISNVCIMEVENGYWITYETDVWDAGSEQRFFSYKELDELRGE